MKFTKLVAASLLALASIPAAAQGNAALTVGATVYGPDDAVVGTITEVTDTYVMLDTGTNKTPFAPESFAAGSNGPRFGLTKAEVDASAEKAKAEREAKLKGVLSVGATVYGADGTQAARVDAVGDDGNIVITAQEVQAAFPREQFTVNDAGQLALRFTTAQLTEALAPLLQQKAALDAALVAQASVFTSDGVEIGKIRERDAEGNVVIDQGGTAFALPPTQFTLNSSGAASLRITKAQLDAALGG